MNKYSYTKKHNEKYPLHQRRRKGLTPYHEPDLICPYCNNPTVEHITPMTNNGNDSIDNLSYCCKSCNSAKGNKLLLMFLCDRPRNNAERYLRMFAR